MIYIGMDDTDNLNSRGTGALARQVAANLALDYEVLGVIRQQLLKDPRVPCTKNNSSKAIVVKASAVDVAGIAGRVRLLMRGDFQQGSDPGLCVTSNVPADVIEWGRRAQRELLTQEEARALAERYGIYLEGLGGDEMGVIGALAAVGLTAGGDAGRYIQVGNVRMLAGAQPVETVLAAGVAAIETAEGEVVLEGMVQTDSLRPARRGGRPVAVVERHDGIWLPLKLA